LREVDAAAEARGLDARDRGFVRRLVGTEVRRRATLRAMLRRFSGEKPDPDLAAHLHLGLVQAYFLDRVPDYALVSETVELVRATCGALASRTANAVLREALRQRRPGRVNDPVRDIPLRDLHVWLPVFHDPRGDPLLWAEDALSMPAPLVKRWEQRYSTETARAIAVWALEEPPLSIVSLKTSASELRHELAALGLDVREGTHPRVLLAPAEAAETVIASAPMREGRATIQGETALRAAEAMQATNGEELLDLCAAPGGKTSVLARSGARVTACDVSEEKLARVRSTLSRLRLEDVELIVSDGTSALEPARTFDGVLIDAPCTNTGVLAQRPEARWRFGPKNKSELVELQARLFAEGAQRVRPGGRLVWSTCSLEPDENSRQVRTFVLANPSWFVEEEHEALPDVAVPRVGGPVDGGYYARLRRG
jgi:16S rRNA (cytosine967-C5)-methyltransferase